jgi:hypothetical protein
MAVAHEKSSDSHAWFVFEALDRRIMKSLSDLNGTDVYIHGGKIEGVFGQLGNAFLRKGPQATAPQMRGIYRKLRSSVFGVLRETGARNVFEARAFQTLSAVAIGLTDELLMHSPQRR